MFYRLTKFMFALMFLYSTYIKDVWGVNIPRVTLLLGVGMMVFLVLDILTNKNKAIFVIPKEITIWLIFGWVTLVTSSITALSVSYAFSSIILFFENLLLMYVVIYIIRKERNMNFVAILYVVVMILGTYSALSNSLLLDRLALSEGANSNVLGHNLVIAMAILLFFIDKHRKYRNVVIFIIEALFFYVIILTGSRLSFITATILIISWILIILPAYSFSRNLLKRILLSSSGIVILIFFAYNFISFFETTFIYERMQNLFGMLKGTNEEARNSLYKLSWDYFRENPILGIGYNNFVIKHGYFYSHSTYAEVIACTGIVGSLLYFYVYLKILKDYWVMLKKKSKYDIENIRIRLILIVMVSLIVLGVGDILFYKMNYFIVFGVIVGMKGIISDRIQTAVH